MLCCDSTSSYKDLKFGFTLSEDWVVVSRELVNTRVIVFCVIYSINIHREHNASQA